MSWQGGPAMVNWLGHWDMRFDPFRPGSAPFVAIPSHEEAIGRLIHLAENGERRAELRSGPGMGKSVVLGEALRRLTRPGRRISLVRTPADEASMIRGLLAGFGRRVRPGSSRSEGIGRLLDALRLADAQRSDVVLAIDDDSLIRAEADDRPVDRIRAVAAQAGGQVTVLVAGRDEGNDDPDDRGSLRIGLDRLTRSDAAAYLSVKLGAAGGTRPAFSDRALLRLHAGSRGNPRLLDRLAGLALRAGAAEGEDPISEGLVAGVLAECEGMLCPALSSN